MSVEVWRYGVMRGNYKTLRICITCKEPISPNIAVFRTPPYQRPILWKHLMCGFKTMEKPR